MASDRLDAWATLERTVDGEWMILVGGIQWAPLGSPRDASGAGSATFPTRAAAIAAYADNERRLSTLEPRRS